MFKTIQQAQNRVTDATPLVNKLKLSLRLSQKWILKPIRNH